MPFNRSNDEADKGKDETAKSTAPITDRISATIQGIKAVVGSLQIEEESDYGKQVEVKQGLVHEHEICIRIDSDASITTLHPSRVRQLGIDPSSLPTIRHQKESHLLKMTFITPGSSEEVSDITIISNKAPYPTISLATLNKPGIADNQAFLLGYEAKSYKMKIQI